MKWRVVYDDVVPKLGTYLTYPTNMVSTSSMYIVVAAAIYYRKFTSELDKQTSGLIARSISILDSSFFVIGSKAVCFRKRSDSVVGAFTNWSFGVPIRYAAFVNRKNIMRPIDSYGCRQSISQTSVTRSQMAALYMGNEIGYWSSVICVIS